MDILILRNHETDVSLSTVGYLQAGARSRDVPCNYENFFFYKSSKCIQRNKGQQKFDVRFVVNSTAHVDF